LSIRPDFLIFSGRMSLIVKHFAICTPFIRHLLPQYWTKRGTLCTSFSEQSLPGSLSSIERGMHIVLIRGKIAGAIPLNSFWHKLDSG